VKARLRLDDESLADVRADEAEEINSPPENDVIQKDAFSA
jgi:hypothetical protein